MSPSSNSPVSERVVVCQRGSELAEFVDLLTTLGVEVEIQAGPLPSAEQVAGAALVIVAGQRLAEGKAALQRWPRTIAVVDDGSRMLNAHLTRIGVSVIVRRPVPPRALRLLILHALYRGPERRSRQRVMIGQPVRAGSGLFKQDATLLELSRTGARIELASPPKIGTPIQFVLGKELTLGKPVRIQAKVVRAIRAADASGRATGEIGLAIVDPAGEHARVIQAILDRHANRPASTASGIPSGRAGADASARGAASPSRSAAEYSPAPPSSRPKPSPRPFAGAALHSLSSLSRSTATSTPTPTPTTTTTTTTTTPSRFGPGDTGTLPPAAAARSAPTAAASAPEPSPPSRSLPPRYDDTERLVASMPVVAPLTTRVEILAADLEPLEGDESDLDYELELDDDLDAGIDATSGEPDAASDAEAPPLDGAKDLGPDETLESERRGSTRVPYTQRVVALGEQAARVVIGRDLSPGGMRIAPNPELAVGDVVKLALHAGTETEPLVVLAGVERDDGEDGLLLAFPALTAPQRERLEKILAATSSILSSDPLDESREGEAIVMGELLRRVARGPSAPRGAGFTLIELMIVVAIIGVIASVAIPLFGRYQLRSKSSEVKTNLSAIRVVQEAHKSEHGRYLAAHAEPALIPGPFPAAFDIGGSDYAEMGWSPEGRVYFSYAVAVSPDATGYTADAAADIDGNGILQIWGYAKPDPLGALTTGGLGCNPAVLDLEEIGLCVVGAPSF